jgi:cobalt-zinc-cadmium efflux system outer membrane protein
VNLIQARAAYAAAWKQLAATVNAPDLPPAPLAGRSEEVVPPYRYADLRDRLLAGHTDLAAARNGVAQAEVAVALERRKPFPDLRTEWYVQNDTLVNSAQTGGKFGFVVPVFDKNQGNILAAQARLARATREEERVRNDLLRQLAEAFGRYEAARQQAAVYRDQILPDLVRAFRGVNERYQVEPDKVNYNDIVTAQQNLAAQLANYLQVLRQQWQAVADLAGIVQADDPAELSAPVMPGVPVRGPTEVPPK